MECQNKQTDEMCHCTSKVGDNNSRCRGEGMEKTECPQRWDVCNPLTQHSATHVSILGSCQLLSQCRGRGLAGERSRQGVDGACSGAIHLWVGLGPRAAGPPAHGALPPHGVHVRRHTPHGALTPSSPAAPARTSSSRALQPCKEGFACLANRGRREPSA